ncbi:MAG: serine hydrolase domain-containing protein [Rhodoferax sp.]
MNKQIQPRSTSNPARSGTASQPLSRRHALQLAGLSGLDLIAPALLAGCGGTDALRPPRVLTQDVKAQLEAATDAVFAQVKPPGMIALISVEGEGDYLIQRGVSDRLSGAPMNQANYFRIASNTKTFTGAAVLILVDEGSIHLDTPIASYLPQYKIPNGERISVRMLGNMTSGLFDYLYDEELLRPFIAGAYSLTYTPDQMLAAAFRHPPNFEPGASYEYCNTNIVLLGLLMEKVTGKPARQVLHEKVILPMGLAHTYWPDTGELPSPYTHGYTESEGGEILDASHWNPSVAYTAGALVSTLADMKLWARAVAEGWLLSEAMKAERFKWINNHYGFCVMKAGDWIGHPGTIWGYNSHVFYNTAKKASYLILVNSAMPQTPVESFTAALLPILSK